GAAGEKSARRELARAERRFPQPDAPWGRSRRGTERRPGGARAQARQALGRRHLLSWKNRIGSGCCVPPYSSLVDSLWRRSIARVAEADGRTTAIVFVPRPRRSV